MKDTKEINIQSAAAEADKCVRCGKCRAVCPVVRSTSEERFSPRARCASFGNDPFDWSASLDACLLCMACTKACPHDVDTAWLVVNARNAGGHSVPKIATHLMKSHSFLKKAGAAAARRTNENISRSLTNKGNKRIFIFQGCQASASPVEAEEVKRAVARFFGEPEEIDEVCCGLPFAAAGDLDAARESAAKNLERLKNATKIYVTCTSCAHTIKHLWPKLFKDIDEPMYRLALSVAESCEEAFAALVKENINLKIAAKNKVTLHLPCHLRNTVLSADTAYSYMERILAHKFIRPKDKETCCGLGGSFALKHSSISSDILRRRSEELAATGADIVLTPCPGCRFYLKKGMDARKSGIKVMHPLLWLAKHAEMEKDAA